MHLLSEKAVSLYPNKVIQPMKKYLFVFLIVAAMAIGCTGGRGNGNVLSDADSIYQWENIRKYLMEEPELALRLIDTSEMRGVADVNYANYMRAQIYYGSPTMEDLDKARDYCLRVLNNQNPVVDSLQRIKIISLLVSVFQKTPEKYQDAVRYAIKGAEMAHKANRLMEEAEFYFNAGTMMERLQQGSGIAYMNSSLELYRKAARNSIAPLPMFSSNLGQMARIYAEEKKYADAISLLEERLLVIERIEKEYSTAPAGWIDQQRAYTYPVMAYCLYMTGDKERAQRMAAAFEQTQAGQQPGNQDDILFYYASSGNAARIQQIYDQLEPYYREKGDTISQNYVSLLALYARGLNEIGRYHEAYQVLDRFSVINDSLVQRERQQETLKYAQQMKTQEKELELKDKEAKARLHLIIILALVVFLVACIIFLWRITLAHRRLQEKNRQLFDTVQQMIQQADKRQEALDRLPEATLSPSQQLYNRICHLMRDQQPYTDSELNRETLAQMLATNYNVVASVIRECTDGQTIGDFLDDWRIRHAAQLVATTSDTVGLIIEESGFSSRSHFNTLFREKFKMTPSEYRKIAQEKKNEG